MRPRNSIISKLRGADVELSKGLTAGSICKKSAISEHTYWVVLSTPGRDGAALVQPRRAMR